MKSRGLKFALALSCGLLAVAANAATVEKQMAKPFADADHVVYAPTNHAVISKARNTLTNHGGGVVV